MPKQIDVTKLIDMAVVFHLGQHTLGWQKNIHCGMELQRARAGSPQGWTIVARVGPMNPWYLGADNVWRYKAGMRWNTKEEAIEAFNCALIFTSWDGFDQNGEELNPQSEELP